jgi:tetratricopeptide (TPR) repeat protein
MRKALIIALAAAAALALAAPPARADGNEEARALFEAGARAYKAGDFRAAIQAFEQAYRVEARPNLLFSIAQAHRRQYVLDKRAGHVAVALRNFREYLSRVPAGGRRTDAVAALGELEPLAAQLEREGQLQPLSEPEQATRVMVSSPVEGAVVSLDDERKTRPTPLIAEVGAGKHVLVVKAPGFADERREIEVTRGAVTALDITLRELPARLAIGGLRGAEVTVDGRSVGKVPFTALVDVPPGPHHVRVAKGGHEDWNADVLLGRGELQVIDPRLARTTQRVVSYGFIGAGAAATAVGLVLGGLSLAQEGAANTLKREMDAGSVVCRTPSCPKLDDYNAAAAARDRLRVGFGVTLGVGLATAATGVLLYFFDEPKGLGGRGEGLAPPPRPTELPLDIAAAPVVAPGVYGASLTGRF